MSIAACFDREDGRQFDYVFNFAAETKYSQASEIYKERILKLSVNCAKEAAKRNIKVFVEMSTAEVYDSNQVTVGCMQCGLHVFNMHTGSF